ncbi:hypothetical protein EDEG_03751 [Edhazardia aedis USNM 41457]|uniref:Uncharacterized protein n=1 Tax=Edhazardia aedis (strain USNM 41457) TaxID=1003232 RepID=J9D1K9_EDHAE|nr:hypothetical protein EDEG_03751 [Edhazardia aedis USNM 41457]|eukprot:EJW01726.1 hypothetical protein EDEG_03751 [Edhazardia aedis USNM 41457]
MKLFSYQITEILKFPLKKFCGITIFSVFFLIGIEYSNSFKLPESSIFLSQKNSPQSADNLHLNVFNGNLDHHLHQNPLQSVAKNKIYIPRNTSPNNLILKNNVKTQNLEKNVSRMKRNIEIEQLTLKNLKIAIYESNFTIFEDYKVEELFDILTSSIDNYDEEFFWKGELFQHIYNDDKIRKLYAIYMIKHLSDYQADNVLDFYYKKLSFCEIQNNDYFGQTNRDNQEYNEKDDEAQLFKKIISTDRNFLDENRVFIKKYNKMFKLFWEHNFLYFHSFANCFR